MKYVFILLMDCEIEDDDEDDFFIFCYMLRNCELKTMTRVERQRLLLTFERVIREKFCNASCQSPVSEAFYHISWSSSVCHGISSIAITCSTYGTMIQSGSRLQSPRESSQWSLRSGFIVYVKGCFLSM